MSEIITISILTILLIIFFIYHVIMIKEQNKQITELVKINKAQTLTEYAVNNKPKKETVIQQEPQEFIASDNIDDIMFEKMIERQLEQNGTR